MSKASDRIRADALDDLELSAERAIGNLANALTAARNIRDRVKAAKGRGLRDDDIERIHRDLGFLDIGIANAEAWKRAIAVKEPALKGDDQE